ncbi:MAG TPA: hypothetical protein VFZ98_13600, partial [Vicinamibacterales bacterium]
RLGRLPLNVVMVLDRSPSMSWNIPGSADQRWAGLKAAAQLFTNVWDVIGAPPAPATISSEGNADDQLGLIFFGGTSVEFPLDGLNFFKRRDGSATPWGATVATALAPDPPAFISATSIGAGTTNGRSRLNTVAKATGDTATLLFTDGEQNQPPCIIHQGETTSPTVKQYPGQPPGVTYLDQCTVAAPIPTAPLTLNGSNLVKDMLPRGPIFTIGLGEGGTAASALLLDAVAQRTAGQSRYPLTSATLTQSFIDTLVDNLKGGTVSLLERTSGALQPSDTASTPMTVTIDPSLTRVAFVLSMRGLSREVQLEIRRPDGTVVTPTLSENGANSRVAAINLPADGPAGNWQVRVVRPPVIELAAVGALTYDLVAYGVESRLSARITESTKIGTGGAVKIVAEVGWDDGGLTDLPAGALVATIERPNENLGNILRLPLTGAAAPQREDASPLMVKFHQLADTQGFLDRITPHPLTQTVTLVSVGHGRYEGTFNDVNVGGHYRVRVQIDWSDPRTGTIRIRRQHPVERQAAVVPSAGSSTVTVTRNPGARTAVILVTPRDRFGNYVGPGFEGGFSVSVNGASAGKVSDPDLTGGYAIHLTGLGPNDDPTIKIDYDGQTLRDGPLSQLSGRGGGRSRVFFDIGGDIPHGTFGNAASGRVSVNGGFEYFLMPSTSVEGIVGYHAFNDGSSSNPRIWQISGNLKQYFDIGQPHWHLFANAGAGVYPLEPGGTSESGFNLGGGAIFDVDPHWSVEGVYNFHRVSTSVSATKFSTLQGGVRIRLP